MIGAVIHGYRIDRALAEDKGGFGEVFFAVHTESGAEAVVKALKPAMSANREFVKRFFNEARAAASIHHPGIVAVHNVGYHEDRAYLLMEKLRGEDLETRLRRGPLPVDRALQFLRQAAGAIGAAHDRGIVHRDLKPANLFIVTDPDVVGGERVKVLDFGIAKLTHDVGTMKTQGVFGTPAYMAPEQCASTADVDGRADLYALGCILYEMIAGRPPFGHGGLELVAAHLRDEPPPLRAVAPWAPPEVEAVVMKLLRKRREERHATCAELVAALGTTATGIPGGPVSGQMAAPVPPVMSMAPTQPAVVARPSGPSSVAPRRTPWMVIALVLLVVAGGATAAVIAMSGDDPPTEMVAAAAPVVDAAPAELPPVVDAAPAAPTVAAIPAPADAAPVEPARTTRERKKDKVIVPAACDEVSCVIDAYEPACCAKFKKPIPVPQPGDLPQYIDKAMISAGVAKVKGRIMSCADKFPDAKGSVKIKVKVSPDGGIDSSSIVTSPDPGLGACVSSAMNAASFAKTQQGGTFNYPFMF
jgi:hypothetical protein